MSIKIEMPKLSDTMTEGTLVKWLKKEGDTVEVGDVLAEVETDKATMEMEAFDDGVLGKILVKEGQAVPVGGHLATLLEDGEEEGDVAEKAEEPKTEKPKEARKETAEPKAEKKQEATPSSGDRVKASPLAKKVAAEKGIDLSGTEGSGPGGRIVRADVEGGKPASAPASKAAPAAAPAKVSAGKEERIPLSGMRKVIAQRLLESKTQIPHFYLFIEINSAPLMKLRAEINAASEAAGQGKVTVNDFVLKAAVAAAVKNPKVNAAFDKDAIIQYGSINLSVAVAIDDGLVTPVIRDAQTKTLREISEAVKDLATRARGKKLKPEEYQGGTFTVSNLGGYGIESFSAIINPPQSMILSIGAIVKKPVINAKGEIVAGQRMSIGLSCDHRVVDGAIGAEYLAELRRLLESPTLMLI